MAWTSSAIGGLLCGEHDIGCGLLHAPGLKCCSAGNSDVGTVLLLTLPLVNAMTRCTVSMLGIISASRSLLSLLV